MTEHVPEKQATLAINPSKPSVQADSGNRPLKKSTQRQIGLGKVILAVSMLVTATAGAMLARIAPIHAFDWGGLLKGRNPKEVLIEGLGQKLSSPYQILVMGIDRVPDVPIDSPQSFDGRSDTVLLVRFDPKEHEVNILSIPRDTQVDIPGVGIAKINAANVYGGANLATTTVKTNFNNVKLDRYARVDIAGLVSLVDALGGIEVDVPKRMKYVDKTQKLNIDLQPGRQTLNGKQAEGFARFRHDEEGDIGRINRQQILLKGIKAKLSEPSLMLRFPGLVDVMQKHIDTNLSWEEMLAIATFSLNVNPNRIHTATLAGKPSAPYQFNSLYWLAEPADIERALEGKFQVEPLSN